MLIGLGIILLIGRIIQNLQFALKYARVVGLGIMHSTLSVVCRAEQSKHTCLNDV